MVQTFTILQRYHIFDGVIVTTVSGFARYLPRYISLSFFMLSDNLTLAIIWFLPIQFLYRYWILNKYVSKSHMFIKFLNLVFFISTTLFCLHYTLSPCYINTQCFIESRRSGAYLFDLSEMGKDLRVRGRGKGKREGIQFAV